ncbi:hypothetical protein EJ08DRAFT_738330 [Tothia fuscella]|uniref:Uncharacterized protein n=1 Tax=Tothia fuscella TaxID=1048955 RepID=A0A9P4NH38_9PEZI|nr:hypothetical protein EJ08DRAFT_738330 [Tothia fuscella]
MLELVLRIAHAVDWTLCSSHHTINYRLKRDWLISRLERGQFFHWIPKQLTIAQLQDLVVICDKYQLISTVSPFVEMWTIQYHHQPGPDRAYIEPFSSIVDLIRIGWIFQLDTHIFGEWCDYATWHLELIDHVPHIHGRALSDRSDSEDNNQAMADLVPHTTGDLPVGLLHNMLHSREAIVEDFFNICIKHKTEYENKLNRANGRVIPSWYGHTSSSTCNLHNHNDASHAREYYLKTIRAMNSLLIAVPKDGYQGSFHSFLQEFNQKRQETYSRIELCPCGLRVNDAKTGTSYYHCPMEICQERWWDHRQERSMLIELLCQPYRLLRSKDVRHESYFYHRAQFQKLIHNPAITHPLLSRCLCLICLPPPSHLFPNGLNTNNSWAEVIVNHQMEQLKELPFHALLTEADIPGPECRYRHGFDESDYARTISRILVLAEAYAKQVTNQPLKAFEAQRSRLWLAEKDTLLQGLKDMGHVPRNYLSPYGR